MSAVQFGVDPYDVLEEARGAAWHDAVRVPVVRDALERVREMVGDGDEVTTTGDADAVMRDAAARDASGGWVSFPREAFERAAAGPQFTGQYVAELEARVHRLVAETNALRALAHGFSVETLCANAPAIMREADEEVATQAIKIAIEELEPEEPSEEDDVVDSSPVGVTAFVSNMLADPD